MENLDLDLIIKVCNLKYKEKMQQNDIAKLLKLSTAKVTRILQKAFDLDIVQVNIVDIKNETSALESDLEKKFGLRRALLVREQANTDNESSMKKMIGQRIANYLLNIIKDKDCIGISHSSTVKECILALPLKIPKKVDVVQMLGGSYNLTFEGLDATRELSDKFSVSPHIIYAPLFVDNNKIKNGILSDSSIKKTFEYFNNINIAIVGIGSFYPVGSSTIFRSGDLSKKEILELQKNNVTGDIFGHFFNSEGDFCKTSVEDRIITIPIGNIMNIDCRIGVAAGASKFTAINSALQGKLVNILATDEKTGQKLLDA
jgi:deoxyribonucleoside regulator